MNVELITVARIENLTYSDPLTIVCGTNLSAGDVCILHGKRGDSLISFLQQAGDRAAKLWNLSALTDDHKISPEETVQLCKEMGI